MRSLAMVLLVVVLGFRPAYAQTPSANLPLAPQQPSGQPKKSRALALTLEAVCPIAGAGGFYAGETDKAAVLAGLSGITGGVAVGSVFWLIHLNNQHPTGASVVTARVEQTTAISLLVTGGIVYLLARVSGLALASEATAPFNPGF